MTVEHWNPETDGKLTEMALRRKLEARSYAVTRYVYPPGTAFPDHAHDVDKCDAVHTGGSLPIRERGVMFPERKKATIF